MLSNGSHKTQWAHFTGCMEVPQSIVNSLSVINCSLIFVCVCVCVSVSVCLCLCLCLCVCVYVCVTPPRGAWRAEFSFSG